jgi:hypothetical protein
LNIDELVGENVRRARINAGVSPHELAHRVAGVGLPLTEPALLQIEAGEGRIGVDELIALGLSLGMPPAMLLSPLNLGSLLWVDAEGSPMASWALFHDDARSFALPGREDIPPGAGRALGTAPAVPAPEGSAGEPAPPPPPPTPADREPLHQQTADLAATAVAPPPPTGARTTISLPEEPLPSRAAAALPEDSPPVPAEADDFRAAPAVEPAGDPPEEPALLFPDPAPREKPVAGLRRDGEPSPHRAWAMEALRTLLGRED